MKVNDLILLTFKNISHRGLRSWLTIIGIIIGIGAVVTLITLGTGLKDTILDFLGDLGSNRVFVLKGKGFAALTGGRFFAGKETRLTLNDLNSIKKARGVKIAGPVYIEHVNGGFRTEKVGFTVYGVEPKSFAEGFTVDVEQGRKLSNSDTNAVVVGHYIAHELFDEELRVNDMLELNNKTYRVVGVLESTGSEQDDMTVFLNWRELRNLVTDFDEDDMFAISVLVYEDFNANEVAENIKEVLRKQHHVMKGEEDFTVLTYDNLLSIVGNILTVLTAFLSGIAAISLLVSAVGIANTMFMSVMERTREIGILKAIGAEDRTILLLFISEAVILGLVGGLIGVLAGFLIAFLINILTGIKISFSVELTVFALLFSVLVGVVAGIIPARKAARLNPIDALRYE